MLKVRFDHLNGEFGSKVALVGFWEYLFCILGTVCTVGYSGYDVFKKLIGVHEYINVKNYSKDLL